MTGTGIRYVSVAHEGNTRESVEEAETIRGLVENLLKGEYLQTDGASGAITPEEIMVVAPYNAQVSCLREHLPDGVKVGTVNKFQGQEAAVCLFSMATSSGEEIPRNLEFLFSRNRLNVAISRARCLAVLVCNPGAVERSVPECGADAVVERALFVCGDGWGATVKRSMLDCVGWTRRFGASHATIPTDGSP